MFIIRKLSLSKSLSVSAILIFSAIASVILTPTYKTLSTPPNLEKDIPLNILQWTNRVSPYAQVSTNPVTQAISDSIYDQVLARAYEDKSGNQIMLAIAFSQEQRQEIKIHRPEVCYPAQGYQMLQSNDHVFKVSGYPYPIYGKQQIFKNENRIEAVSYWIRLGDAYPKTGLEMRIKILRDGLKGKLDDGVLVRVSSVINNESEAQAAFEIHERFIENLLNAASNTSLNLLVTNKNSF
jgi:EpsI family protein